QKKNADYDIALVKLTGSIPLNNSRVVAAKLPDVKRGFKWPLSNVQFAISAWGCTRQDGPGQEVARAVWMRTIRKQECVDSDGRNFEWKPEMRFCAEHYKGGGAICPGGSGSGLVCRYGLQYYLVSVQSTAGVKVDEQPSFFVRVSYFLNWINQVIHSN
ncbi:hypothetical protein PHET_07536, partial [Paragonimus heterotremus]